MQKNYAKKVLLILTIAFQISAKIRLIEPNENIMEIRNESGQLGELDYTVSMFGDIDYLRDDKIELLIPSASNSYGCEPLSDSRLQVESRYAFLLKRGKCTFTKKSTHAKLVSL